MVVRKTRFGSHHARSLEKKQRPHQQRPTAAPPPPPTSLHASDRYFEGATAVIASKDSRAVKPTRVPHAWASQLRDTALATGAELKTAGTLLHQGGDALDATDRLGLEAHALGSQSTQLGAQLEAGAEASVVRASTVHADVADLHQRAHSLVERASDEQKRGRNLAQRAIDKLRDGAQALGRALKAYTHGVAKAVDYEANIDALGEHDTYTLGIEGFLMAAGLVVEGAASIEVEKAGGVYSVTIGGEAAAGIFVDFGIKVLGIGADAFAEATAGRGVGYELQFATADEAKKAVGLMLGRIGRKATLRELTPEQKDLFKSHLHAVELSGKAAMLGWAMLRLPSAFAAVTEAEASTTRTMRLSLGERPALTVSEESAASIYATANAATRGDVLGLFALSGGKAEAKVALHRKIDLLERPDLGDPLGALKALSRTVERTGGEQRVELSYDSKGGVLGSGGGLSLGLTMNGAYDSFIASGAAGCVLRGDVEGALDKLPPHTEVEGTVQKFADYGVDIGPAVYFMSFGAGVELEALRKDVDFDSIKTATAPVRDAYRAVKQWLSDVVDTATS